MRSELEQLEQIDQYLSGKMTPDQATAFESQMNADPALKSMVKDQQLLIQTVSRKAMLAEINAVAGIAAGAAAGGGATAAGWGVTQWVIATVSVVGATVGGVAIYNAVTDDEQAAIEETINENDNSNVVLTEDTYDTSEYFAFIPGVEEESMNAEEEDETYEEDERTVYDPNTDPSLEDRQDPLNDFGNVNKPDLGNDNDINAEIEDRDSNVGIMKNKKASFPGGHVALQNWFEKNLMYPGTAKEDKVQGTIRVRFHVKETGEIDIIDSECIQLLDEDGKLIDGWRRARYRKSIKYFRQQAERAFRICPKWDPATNTNGTRVLSEQVWYVKYNLKGKTEVYSFGDDTGYMEHDDSDGIHNYSDEGIFFEVETAEDELIEPMDK